MFSNFFSNLKDGLLDVFYVIFPNHQDLIPFNLYEAWIDFLPYIYTLDVILPVKFLFQLFGIAVTLEIIIAVLRVNLWLVNRITPGS